ncbi:MAG: DUF790 family protein [Myxococcales bacterium]|nr:DUF790 family protein [Myxococcales bacterium]
MLTANLVRVRISDGRVVPQYVSTSSAQQQQRAAALIALFQDSVGSSRADLDEAISDHIGVQTDFLVQRGLVKLLLDRTDFEVNSPANPMELRQRVFRLAATLLPIVRHADGLPGTPRRTVLEKVAEHYGVNWTDIDAALWADKPDAQRIRSVDLLEPGELLDRYNTALAQGVLLRAESMTVHLDPQTSPGRVRTVLRAVKFFGLSHRIIRDEENDALVIHLDGPLSLFQGNTRYGLQMANFLPVLLLAENWKLEAKVKWGDNDKAARFCLSPEQGLRSHYADRGSWQSEEEVLLRQKLASVSGPWTLSERSEVLSLKGGDVAIPDLTLVHQDGGLVWVELLGFWRKASLVPRLAALKKAAVGNYILVVSERLQMDSEELDTTPIPILRYKGVISHKKLLELAGKLPRTTDIPSPFRQF